MNFKVKVKYFSFYSPNSGGSLNFNFLTGSENKYPKRNVVIIDPPVIVFTPE